MTTPRTLFVAVACAMLLAFAGLSPAFAEEVKIGAGAAPTENVFKKIQDPLEKATGVKLVLISNGPSEALKELDKGTVQAASGGVTFPDWMALMEKEGYAIPDKGVYKSRVIGKDVIKVLVNKDVTVKQLSNDQLKAVFTGKAKNWKEVGGPDAPIVVVGRDSSSGTYGTWQEMVVEKGTAKGEKSRVTARAQVVASSGAMLTTVASNKFAIGYDGIGYVNDTVRALRVDGVAPSAENAGKKLYPLSRSLYMYTNGTPVGDVKDFIDYMLSQDGQRIVEETGFIPVSR